MKKSILLLLIIALIAGCGITAKDGSDGSNGSNGLNGDNGSNGRDYQTPVLRPFTTANMVVSFSDVGTKNIQLSVVGMSDNDWDNYLIIYVPAGSVGQKLRVIINGIVSKELTVSDSGVTNITFMVTSGIDSSTTVFMNCSAIDSTNNKSYFSWYLNGIQQEYYFADSFGNL